MRPRIGKTPHWDKVTPSEQKELDKVAKKYVIVKWLHIWNDPAHWERQSKWAYHVEEDTPSLRWNIKNHPNAEIVMEKLRAHDAIMWAKMME
jgi:hypothetical protein